MEKKKNPQPKQFIGKDLKSNPQNINKKGRPRKFTTKLKEYGYARCEINDTIQTMLAMNMDEIKDVENHPMATALEKTIAVAILKSIGKGSLFSIETLLSRAFGQPKQEVEQTILAEQPLFGDSSEK